MSSCSTTSPHVSAWEGLRGACGHWRRPERRHTRVVWVWAKATTRQQHLRHLRLVSTAMAASAVRGSPGEGCSPAVPVPAAAEAGCTGKRGGVRHPPIAAPSPSASQPLPLPGPARSWPCLPRPHPCTCPRRWRATARRRRPPPSRPPPPWPPVTPWAGSTTCCATCCPPSSAATRCTTSAPPTPRRLPAASTA